MKLTYGGEPFGILGKTRFYTMNTIPFKDEAEKNFILAHIKRITVGELKRAAPTPQHWEKAREWMDIARGLVHKKLRLAWDKGAIQDFLRWEMPIPDSGCEWLDQLCLEFVSAMVNRKATNEFSDLPRSDAGEEVAKRTERTTRSGAPHRYHRGKKKFKQKSNKKAFRAR